MALNTAIEDSQVNPVQTLVADGSGNLVVPLGMSLFTATFDRSGHDLILKDTGDADIRIPEYFLTEAPADLYDASGAVVRGSHVSLMAGPIAPGQYAQVGQEVGASPIGQVEVLDGDATVQRVDGTTETLQVGTKIFENDVLQTGEDTSLSVTFVDGTIFTLASASRMVIDELIYDPDASDNSGGFSLIQGSFVFIAGQVAKTGGMEVSTPSSTMGIRGTTVVVEIFADKGTITSEITLAQDIDGKQGRIELFDIEGNLVADIIETDTKWVVESYEGGVREVNRSAQDESSDSILIAEAFAAFRAATSRVEAGDTFVTLTDPGVVGRIENNGQDVDNDFNVDSVDDPESIAPPSSLEEVPEGDEFLPLDEGFNQQLPEPVVEEPPIVVVQGGALTEGEDIFEVNGQVVAQDADAGSPVTWTGMSQAKIGTFVLGTDGAWSYQLNNTLADPLTEGQVVVETLLAVATDNDGNATPQYIEVAITGTNDQPVVTPVVTIETIKGTTVDGSLSASDVDGAVSNLVFSTVEGSGSNGTGTVNPDGTYKFDPSVGFVGIASFQYQVKDADDGISNGLVRVLVDNDPNDVSNQNVGLSLNLVADADAAAGAVEISVQKETATSINLAIALDRSGSIGSAAWSDLLTAVETSVTDLASLFDGASTQVDVQIITYASDVDATPVYDLHDPALISAIDPSNLTFDGGNTAWNLAFQQAGTFFFTEPSNELNYLFFVTDGIPSSGTWVQPFDALIDPTDDFDVTVEAFGFGPQYASGSLLELDSNPVTFTQPSQLNDAFASTPIFNPELIGFKIELIADGGSVLEIADENSAGLIVEGTDFELPLASIANIASLLGENNQIDITAQFDLDNDVSDTEVTLLSSDIIGKASAAQTLQGFEGADLLFGSDAADTIDGAGGDDVILAFGGDDNISGGTGADTILAGAGDDRITIATLPEVGDRVDGQDGRDTLAFEAVGDINDMIATLDISGIESFDLTNGATDSLALTVDDVIGFSSEDDDELQNLLNDALPNTLSIYGDAGDSFAIDVQSVYDVEEIGTVTDTSGNDLKVYAFSIGGGNAMAALGIDTDVDVTVVNSV